MRVALIGEVGERQWHAIHVLDRAGLGISPGLQLDLVNTFCRDVTATREAIWFADYRQDPERCDSPIPAMHGFRSYVSVPVVLADGRVFGTLCTLDPDPRPVTDEILHAMQALAAVVAEQIGAPQVRETDEPDEEAKQDRPSSPESRLRASEVLNSALRQEGKEREEFIAVLAHDLRNPLQAIRVTSDLLSLSATSEAQQSLLRHLDDSADRMAELIDVTLDFARGRLGSGIALRVRPWRDLSALLANAAEQAMAPYPGCPLIVELTLPEVVSCDADRLCQLVSNLLINAAIHGRKGSPIALRGHADDTTLVLDVHNQGVIAEASMKTLFEPFHRTGDQRLDSGLGLGLYIASQIAVSHGGALTVQSSDAIGTTFTLRMPLRGAPQASVPAVHSGGGSIA
ncbi:GAF domain-containing sensor histidine kinase [Stenotrophomonas pennii]|uniref:GAF domain-containing sensor histidine kinase n=1 Tax=Stenotrophomonas lacuserhaii TaxID=2760084 RepID=UPI003207BED8